MVKTKSFGTCTALAALLMCGGARAEAEAVETSTPATSAAEPPAATAKTAADPALHHPPIATAPSGEALVLEASIDHPQLVKRALAVFHGAGDPTVREVEFQRGLSGYVAELPAASVRPPWIAYALEIELVDGSRRPVFASRKAPHLVEIPEDRTDARERAQYQRLGRRRSVASATAEYVDFGLSQALVTDQQTGAVSLGEVEDNYYRIEGAYTYRPLRLVSEFSMRLGIVRGKSPVPLEADEVAEDETDRFAVGLDYGAPTVRIHAADLVHLEGELLVGLTEVRVAAGAGGAIIIGDPFGTRLTVGFEMIEVFGNRFYGRFDLRAARRLMIAPMVEATNMPHANRYGVRLLGEISFDIGEGFSVAARGGYQARLATEGGPAAGATLAYAF